MKRLKYLCMLAFCMVLSINAYAQQLDGFKYVWVETLRYSNNRVDVWGISAKVRKAFVEKGFILLNENNTEQVSKSEYIQSVLKVYIDHTAVTNGVNRVTLTLTDVDNNQVMVLTGGGMGLTLQSDYNNATNRALSKLKSMSYSFDPAKMPKEYLPEVEKTDWNEEKLRTYYDTTTVALNALEGIYKSIADENTGEMRVGVVKDGYKYKVIILESDDYRWKLGEVKAVFEPADRVYSVSWYLGNKTKTECFGAWNSNGILEVDLRPKLEATVRFVKIHPLSQPKSTDKSPAEDNRPKNTVKATGTGFAISTDGYIATNEHVVNGANRVTVDVFSPETGIANKYEAKIIVSDPVNDVAIIKIEDPDFNGFKPLPYSLETRANIGADVYTIGFPLSSVMGSNFKVANGIISAKTGVNDDIRKYQITVPIQPGNSGGPLLNKDGNIVGITSSALNADAVGTRVENVNYAVKSLYLLNAIYTIPTMEEMPTDSSVKGLSLEQQIDIIKDYICLIKIY